MSTTVIRDQPGRTGTTGARPGAVGFLTDTTLCIGCKACEVACKQWNQLPMDEFGFTGYSYDNTGDLSATTWRHVAFIERISDSEGRRPTTMRAFQSNWLMMSDVCKHCVNAGCMEACPTGAIIRTEFDTVVVQQDVCNGCGYCVPACPFGVIALDLGDGRARVGDHKAHKCTLCYDRLRDGLEPACAKACPTDSIQFGLVEDLMDRAKQRVADLRAQGVEEAHIYGDRAVGGTGGIEGLNAFFILTAPPEVYNLPAQPELPQRKTIPASVSTALAAVAFAVGAILSLRRK
ncbi:4Fe-4S dicluster domain-containing protein [Sphaerobacter sp.]|uniref:4Fe-4S dicluster domain-containing protein n=1 Tax=Sphaerobacter sp. TaxID=2099654 RepID=UPI001D559EA4|nr:4Fe-4S dicluster domain-containing protein [Sphaerobacter sp.]MBX5444088.1 4Fe-4S dicluster domain-containing protein [Sphaerobacter sp.]